MNANDKTTTGHSVDPNTLLAEKYGDREERVYSIQLHFLREIADKASDYFKGMACPEFAEMNGGEDTLFEELRKADSNYDQWLKDGIG